MSAGRGEARGARRRRLRRGVLLKLPFAARSLARLLNTCLAGCRDIDITEIAITESDVTENDITENDITESDITESDIT